MTDPKPEIRLTQHLVETLKTESELTLTTSNRWSRIFTAPVIRTLVGVAAEVLYCHAQRGDDKCWMDFARVYVAAGLPPPDNSVGDKEAMLKNCERYVRVYCSGGTWPSYTELEAEVVKLRAALTKHTDDPGGYLAVGVFVSRVDAAEAERDRLAAEVARLQAELNPPDRPVDLTKLDLYENGFISTKDVETCLKVIRTLRNVCLDREVFDANGAVVLSHAHATIHDLVKEAEKETPS
jgi:hypothetical protein